MCLSVSHVVCQLEAWINKCVVRENIHTHYGWNFTPGFSISVRNWWPPLFLQSKTKTPPTPLEKFIFTKKDYQSKEQHRLLLCNGFHLILLTGLELEHSKLPTKQPKLQNIAYPFKVVSVRLPWCASKGEGGGTPIHYLYGYVPPNGVVILKLLV